MIAIIAGSVIIAVVLAAMVCTIAMATGWRVALGMMAFSITVTAIVVAAALLIGYGIETRP